MLVCYCKPLHDFDDVRARERVTYYRLRALEHALAVVTIALRLLTDKDLYDLLVNDNLLILVVGGLSLASAVVLYFGVQSATPFVRRESLGAERSVRV